MILVIAYIIACGVLNRARGTQLFNLAGSTEIGRIVSMATISIFTSFFMIPNNTKILEMFIVIFAGLMLWCSPAWDTYWSAEIGNDKAHSKLWGCYHMAVRQMLILPTFIAAASVSNHPEKYIYSLSGLTLWIPYLAWGAVNSSKSIGRAEYTIGAIIGATLYMMVS
jgi:hypothetical protein